MRRICSDKFFLAIGRGANSFEIAGFFNTFPAKAINSAYALNPRRAADSLRVEIPLVKPALDLAAMAAGYLPEPESSPI